MSVRKAAWLAMALGVALLLVFGSFLVSQTVGISEDVDDMSMGYDPASSQAALLGTAISDMHRGVATFLLTGAEDDLQPYVDGTRRSDLAVQQLRVLLRPDDQLSALLGRVDSDRQQWIDRVSRPTIDAERAGDQTAALAIFTDPASDALFADLQSDTAALEAAINQRRTEAFDELTALSYRLVLTVIGSLLLLSLFLMLSFFVARRRLLRPLDQLRQQILVVARRGEHTRTITSSGPAELRALGSDVEVLRRQLVVEIDEARSAREALEQRAPVVAAIRAELSTDSAVSVPGLAIHGELQPAEGVLAGDWWASSELPTGEAAVVVADISGHGPAAGIAAMRLKNAIRHDLAAGKDIGDMASSGAEVFASYPDRFATVAAVCIHPETGHVRYINAGHHEPLIVDAAGAVVQRLAKTGPILSWLGGSWGIGTGTLLPGQTLVLYTDGLIESHDFAGEELGEGQLEAWLADVPPDQREPRDLVPWLLGAARERAVDWNRDDVTIVAVQRAPAKAASSASGTSAAVRRRLRSSAT